MSSSVLLLHPVYPNSGPTLVIKGLIFSVKHAHAFLFLLCISKWAETFVLSAAQAPDAPIQYAVWCSYWNIPIVVTSD